MKILVTGAAGRVGTAVRRELAGKYDLRLLDKAPIEEPGAECVVGDMADWHAVRQAVEGVDGIIHLAFGQIPWDWNQPLDPAREWELDEVSYDVNVKGTFWLLKAAVQAGVKRAVYASTLSVYDGNWPEEGEVFDESVQPMPAGTYAVTKYMGEDLFRVFARHHNLPSVCLRLTGVMSQEEVDRAKVKRHQGWHRGATHVKDVARAFRLALERDNTGCDVIIICGDNPERQWNISKSRDVLGFWPEFGFGP
ncbi:MAG: NAD(P)-dependent oxidoreductase [Armatimonadetes bacterium]|nr:NAD(P)-dependent oxidoreductase [Armatimonadota bacterium]